MSYKLYALGFDEPYPREGDRAHVFYVRAQNLRQGQSETVPGVIARFMDKAGFVRGNASWVEGGKLRVWYVVAPDSSAARSARARHDAVGRAMERAAGYLGRNVRFDLVDVDTGAAQGPTFTAPVWVTVLPWVLVGTTVVGSAVAITYLLQRQGTPQLAANRRRRRCRTSRGCR